jgi:hypothetical protein
MEVAEFGNTKEAVPIVCGSCQLTALIVANTSMSRRQKLYGRGFFDCLVHLICSHKDNYFTRYKAALVCDY